MLKENIIKVLKDQGRTQAELARVLGVTVNTLQYYFHGNITLSKLAEIAGALNVEPWRLIKPIEPGETIPERKPQTETTTAAICPNCGKVLRITIK